MKNLKSILLAGFITVSAFSATIFTSCNPDACKDVVCNNNGTCTDGTCTCAVGFEGTNCDTESRTKVFGSFLLSGTDSDGGTYTNISATVATSSTSATKFIFSIPLASISQACTMSGANSFTIDQTTISGVTTTGSGTYTGTTLTISLSQNDATGTTVFTLSGNKQ
jgi:hypothetical protein